MHSYKSFHDFCEFFFISGEPFQEEVVMPMTQRQKREIFESACFDKFTKSSFCQIHQVQGHCNWQLVSDQCKRTCGLCAVTRYHCFLIILQFD